MHQWLTFAVSPLGQQHAGHCKVSYQLSKFLLATDSLQVAILSGCPNRCMPGDPPCWHDVSNYPSLGHA